MSQIGNKIFKSKKLGEGGYGGVFLCHDEHQRKFAVKILENGKSGIESPIEPVILSSLSHPSLVKAVHTTMISNSLHIFMEVALCDGSEYRRLHGTLHGEGLREMAYSLTQAVACLHSNNLIHGDIKCGNILFYPHRPDSFSSEKEGKGTWKLTDFSHTVMYYPNFDNYRKVVSTRHYRPLETFDEGWNQSLDIWCLGCTIYEMAFGRSLITQQLNQEERKLSSREKHKREDIFKARHLNALLDWVELWNSSTLYRLEAKTVLQKDPKITNQPLNINPELWESTDFANFLRPLLHPIAKMRPASSQIVENNYFLPLTATNKREPVKIRHAIISPEKLKDGKKKITNFVNSIKPCVPESIKPVLIQVATTIYCQTDYIDSKTRTGFSVWFADKLVWRNKTETNAEYLLAEAKMAEITSWYFM
jgi:serine/threonine protein kinase